MQELPRAKPSKPGTGHARYAIWIPIIGAMAVEIRTVHLGLLIDMFFGRVGGLGMSCFHFIL